MFPSDGWRLQLYGELIAPATIPLILTFAV